MTAQGGVDKKLRKTILGVALLVSVLGPAVFGSNAAGLVGSVTDPAITQPILPAPPPSVPPPPVGVPKLPAPVKVPTNPPTPPPVNLPEIEVPSKPSVAGGAAGALPTAPGGAGEQASAPASSGATPARHPVAGGRAGKQKDSITDAGPSRIRLEDSRVAPVRGWLIRIWPAVALGPTSVATLLKILETETSRLSSDLVRTLREIAIDGPTAPTTGVTEANRATTSVDPPSAPRAWFPSDPPLPIALFWVVVAAGVALISLVARRELGLPAHKRRWRV